jgi:hypothetical protein
MWELLMNEQSIGQTPWYPAQIGRPKLQTTKRFSLIRLVGLGSAVAYLAIVGAFALLKVTIPPFVLDPITWAELIYGPAIAAIPTFVLILVVTLHNLDTMTWAELIYGPAIAASSIAKIWA